MKSEPYLSVENIEDILAFCLDAIGKYKWSIEDCLNHFPHHKTDLATLLNQYTLLNQHKIHSPSQDFKKNGYKQLVRKLSANQPNDTKVSPRTIGINFSRKVRWGFSFIQILIITIIALASISGGMVYASNDAEPGDILYGLDIAVEQISMVFMTSDASSAQFHLELAAERLVESQGRLLENDFENFEIAANAYNEEISKLNQIIAELDDDEKKSLKESAEKTFSAQYATLSGLLDKVPLPAQEAIQGIIDGSKLKFDDQPGPPENAGPPKSDDLPGKGSPPAKSNSSDKKRAPKDPPGLKTKDCITSISEEDARALEELASTYEYRYDAIARIYCSLGSLELVEQQIKGKQGAQH